MAMNVSKGMKKAMKGKSMDPKMTAGAGGGLGRIQKSDQAMGKGSAKIRST
jgi:hypothetical protein